jgi:4-amino-4-deoxy-L-arabinose transferase-like glycosyltransferase
MRLSRFWLVLTLTLFCFPLFVGLDRADIENDEAIYSFGVDRILEIGDWLAPRSSPHEDQVFLEKPPLKFWIVAAPMRIGLLPHGEFGMRFWDAAFGGLAFLYVFAIGHLLAGPVCGAVGVLTLFVHWPLLFEHGLRSNNMEAALLLSYCAGVFHFMRWARADSDRARLAHALVVGLAFSLGFMTKFVAAVFLPMILGLTALVFSDVRRRLFTGWRQWAAAMGLVLFVCAPWFVYAHVRFGALLWQTILGEHVYNRFTAYLDPAHLQPWYFYAQSMHDRLIESQSRGLVLAGLAVLAVQAVRRRWPEGFLALIWLVIPIALISTGTSKLYHYTYPFLPPLGLAAGYLVANAITLTSLALNTSLRRVDWNWIAPRAALVRLLDQPAVRLTLLAIAALALAIGAASLVIGSVRLEVGSTVLFRSSGIVRPALIGLLFGLLAGARRSAARVTAALLVTSLLPIPAYRTTLGRLMTDEHPMATTSACVQGVAATLDATSARGLYMDVPPEIVTHGMNYYFRRVRPWTRADPPSPEALDAQLRDAADGRPILVSEAIYQSFMRGGETGARQRTASPPLVSFPDVVLILPGPYSACANVTGTRGVRSGPRSGRTAS